MRAVWKGPFIDRQILREIDQLQKLNKKKVPINVAFLIQIVQPCKASKNERAQICSWP